MQIRWRGLARLPTLEVVDRHAVAEVAVVASGWGERADWLRNVRVWPEMTIAVGSRRVAARATRVDVGAAASSCCGTDSAIRVLSAP
jgi:hypothetical protein